MSRIKAGQPKRLGEKLISLRRTLGMTQEAMLEALKKEAPDGAILHLGYLSRYETGDRIPTLLVLLAYSRVGRIPMERLADDRMDLP